MYFALYLLSKLSLEFIQMAKFDNFLKCFDLIVPIEDVVGEIFS